MIERCFIYGFVVGIALSPSGSSSTLDDSAVSINDCILKTNKSAIAIGQDQNRTVSCRNIVISGAVYAFNCLDYGRQRGDCPSIHGAQIDNVRYLFGISSWASAGVVDRLYCEVCLGIGAIGGQGYVFNGCMFNLACADGMPAINCHLANMSRTVFNGCCLVLNASPSGDAAPIYVQNSGPLSFNNCSLGFLGSNFPPLWINNRLDFVTFDNTWVAENPGTFFSQVMPIQWDNTLVNNLVLPGCFLYPLNPTSSEGWTSPQWVSNLTRFIYIGTVAGITVDSTHGTATLAAGSALLGDLILANNTYAIPIDGYSQYTTPVVGVVTSVDGSGVPTMSYMPNYMLDPTHGLQPTDGL